MVKILYPNTFFKVKETSIIVMFHHKLKLNIYIIHNKYIITNSLSSIQNIK